MPSTGELTRLLQAWSGGDADALAQLTPIVYAELHRIARSRMAGERGGHLLQPSALVNEAFLRLIGQGPVGEWTSRGHFYAFSATLMRRILIDFARAQGRQKRGPPQALVPLAEAEVAAGSSPNPINLIDLDRALDELAALDPRQARIVELRYFGGLENAEVARILEISDATVMRDWRIARAWLQDHLGA